MKSRKTSFEPVKRSLQDMLGKDYVRALCEARAFLASEPLAELTALGRRKVNFFPRRFHRQLTALLRHCGTACVPGLKASAGGATSNAFRAHSKSARAPLSALGYYRVGEDGRLFITSKSGHYHVPLGHRFPGYGLAEHARSLGVPNATHNNTRGHIARLLEEALVATAAGLEPGDSGGLSRVLRSRSSTVLNRVLNLETGSLAAEAALKLVLARFHRAQPGVPKPKYAGRIPVLLVLGDDEGGCQANYHGTTILTQVMRGMWPGLTAPLESSRALVVRSVRPENMNELEYFFAEYEQGRHKLAAFFHELVLMNYGGRRLSKAFIKKAYSLCRKHDVPTVVDEIQTCVWSPEVYMYREYGVKPWAVVVGKGFPGGEYAASRVLFSAALDTLPQFGALVTNGQEELASLAYLVTLTWARANAEVTRAIGEYYEERLHGLADAYNEVVADIHGSRHMAGIYFDDLETTQAFVAYLNNAGLDISAQTYKAGCPPSALTKLPLIAGYEAVDVVIGKMTDALESIRGGTS